MSLDHAAGSIGVGAVTHHILLVEDQPDEAAALKRALEEHHFQVSVAKDGGQAHASFVMRKPDFVVLDLILPGESGFEVCQHMKQTNPNVPVLIYSQIDMTDARKLAERVGADGYLVKPAPTETIVQMIHGISDRVWQRTHHQASPAHETERVRFNCACGKRFKVSAAHRGKSLSCPNCGEPVVVPLG